MTVIVCLDNANGMMFNHRRQSRDANVVKDILKTINGASLFVVLEGFAVRIEFEDSNDLIFAEAGKRVKCNRRMLLVKIGVGVFAEVGKHRAVIHVMAVNHKVVTKETLI